MHSAVRSPGVGVLFKLKPVCYIYMHTHKNPPNQQSQLQNKLKFQYIEKHQNKEEN